MFRFNRRQFLRGAGLGALASAWARPAEAGSFFWKRLFSVPPRETSLITPNTKFYVVNYEGFPTLDLASWSLYVGGLVKKPMRLTYADFYSRSTVEMTATLICIDTLPGADSLGNAVWRGFSLKSLLEEAGPDPAAYDVVFRGADHYSDSIPFTRAMQEDVLLAYIMNGAVLPLEHGYPLRAVVPGLYGIKNVKWITEIEVVDYNYKGYWQQRGWTDEGHVRIVSRIDSPGHYQEVKDRRHRVRGLAFGGLHGIRRVELSTDGGDQWEAAQIEPPISPYSWVLWSFDWTPASPGAYTLAVRAYDGRGVRQDSKIERAFPSGASGYHTVVALVS
ncbi:MAG TPA: molybdopterin-dependent oxidoreductase [Nitrospiria bacterium]